MRFRLTLNWYFLAILLLFLAPSEASAGNAAGSAHPQAAESTATAKAELRAPTDREGAGLRGPVAQCIEETSYGNWKMVYETKYDADGRTLEQGYTNNDGSQGLETFTYDAEGHLLRAAWGGQSVGPGTIYSYDSQGRLVGVTGHGNWTTTIDYDAQGRKTRTVKSTLAVSSTSSQPFVDIERKNADLFVDPPPGGWVTTSYNDQNQPIESRVYGSTEQLMNRVTRSYDEKGRVANSAYVIENFQTFLSPATRERLASDPKAFEEVQGEFAKLLGPQQILIQISYAYDDQGRLKERGEHLGPSDYFITKTTYNDHDDEAEEIQITSHHEQPAQTDVVNFNYQYDSVGNWTEKTASSDATAKQPSSIDHRTITYY